jgi:hypothetical protein
MVRFDTATGLVDIDVEGVEVGAYPFYRRKVLAHVRDCLGNI